MKFLASVLVTILGFAVAALIVMYSGAVSVSVLDKPSAFQSWILSTTMENSVNSRAGDITVPDLEKEVMIETGATHYVTMCQTCHGAPGVNLSAMARGLEPIPPLLYHKEEAEEWSAAEKFWITKNGIMMTGMPSWGVTHSDEEIWAIVAFLQKLPGLSEAKYKTMTQSTKTESGHSHADGDGHSH
ncbi:c-type cytochrome [candidate division KSB1 bacterium]|nr:c-type cytochrome [candidate division KSB1 bacterium]